MIADIREYMSHHKIANTKEMARELSIDENQLIVVLEMLNIKVVKNPKTPCSFGTCNPKNRLKCGSSCEY